MVVCVYVLKLYAAQIKIVDFHFSLYHQHELAIAAMLATLLHLCYQNSIRRFSTNKKISLVQLASNFWGETLVWLFAFNHICYSFIHFNLHFFAFGAQTTLRLENFSSNVLHKNQTEFRYFHFFFR